LSNSSQSKLLVRPDRDAASALPALEDLFRASARDVRTRLVNRAGSDVPVRLGVAQVTTVGRILEDTDARDGGVFGLFRFNPMGLPGLVVVQGRLLSRLVGVLLGEDPDEEPPPYRVRPVTQVEMRFCRRITDDVLNSLSAAWPKNPRPSLDIESLGSNPRLAKGLSQTTAVVAASLDFGRPDAPYGLMIVAIPAQAARDLRVPKIEAITPERRRRRYDSRRLLPVKVEAVAELARTRLTLSQLQDLRVGTEIDLGSYNQVHLKVNGRTLFEGEPGSSGGSHCVKINCRIASVEESPQT
jgi:flagellar motor switch protein FliM